MHLIKNGNKYYTVKNNNSNYGIYGNYYTIINGRLLWANPNIYLQSSGTQYINTGITKNNEKPIWNFKGVINFSNVTTRQIMGAGGYVYFGCVNGKWQIGQSSSSNTGKTIQANINNKFDIRIDATNSTYTATINNENFSGNTATQTTSNDKMFLFNIATLNYYCSCNLNYLKISKNNMLMRHFVPVPKGLLIGNFVVPSNGMFDIVEQKFYENKGTGNFTIGGIPEDYIIEGSKLLWCNPNIYLQSNGGKYIDTEVKPTNLTTIEGRVMLTTINKCIYGSRTSKSDSDIHDWIVNTATTNFPQFGSDDSSITYSWYLNQIYAIKNGQNGAYINNSLVRNYNTYTFTSTWNMYLFGLNQAGSLESRSLMGRIYDFQIKENDKLIRYFLPVNTGTIIGNFTVPEPGMWDAVTKKFYPNKGSGTFTYGKDN